jgi:hypothetical protein
MAGTLISLLPVVLQVWGGYQDRQHENSRLAAEHQLQRELAAAALRHQKVALGVNTGVAVAGLAAPFLVEEWRRRRDRKAWDEQRNSLLVSRHPGGGFWPTPKPPQPADESGWAGERESAPLPAGYPFLAGPGALRSNLGLLDRDGRVPLILLVPVPRDSAQQYWRRDLIYRVSADLADYDAAIVYRADRYFQWPDALVYQKELSNRPAIVMEMTFDGKRLDIMIGGCHLGPEPGCAPFPKKSFRVKFPSLTDWDEDMVEQLNSTSAERGHGQFSMPHDSETLADINHELAARVAALCAIAALDKHYIMTIPAYDEQLDSAVLRAGPVADDWNWSEDYLGLLRLDSVADPAYHALNCCSRLLRRGQADKAYTELRLALTLLAGMPDDGARGLDDLMRRAVKAGLMHSKHRDKLRALLPQFDRSQSLIELLDTMREPPAPVALPVEAESDCDPTGDPLAT